MITYNTLEEALRDGVKFMDCGDNGDYAEYLKFSDEYFVVDQSDKRENCCTSCYKKMEKKVKQ